MNKKELIAAIKEGQVHLERALEGLDDRSMGEAGVLGDWSVKDLLAHLSRWEAQVVAVLFQIQRGAKPSAAQANKMSREELNEKWYKESKERSLAQVQSDLEGVHRQILRRVDELSDSDLADANRYSSLNGESLAAYIANDTFEHEMEHAKHIHQWKQKRAPRTETQ